MKGHGGELWHSAGVQVTTTTRTITQVKVQLPGVFYCHFKSGHSPGAPQFQPFINSSPTPRTLWAPQGKAVTLITPPRNSCPFFSHPVQKGSSAQRRKLCLAPAQLRSCSCLARWNTRHKAQRFQGIQEISHQYSAQIPAPQHSHYLVWHMHRSHGNQHPSFNSIISAVWGSQNLWCPSHGSELLCANQPREQRQEIKEENAAKSGVFFLNLSATWEGRSGMGRTVPAAKGKRLLCNHLQQARLTCCKSTPAF